MAVNLKSADLALKSYYLDAIAEQLNFKTNPLLAAIKQSTDDIYGKDVRKVTTYGINGGIGAGTEDGDLPKASGNLYGGRCYFICQPQWKYFSTRASILF